MSTPDNPDSLGTYYDELTDEPFTAEQWEWLLSKPRDPRMVHIAPENTASPTDEAL